MNTLYLVKLEKKEELETQRWLVAQPGVGFGVIKAQILARKTCTEREGGTWVVTHSEPVCKTPETLLYAI